MEVPSAWVRFFRLCYVLVGTATQKARLPTSVRLRLTSSRSSSTDRREREDIMSHVVGGMRGTMKDQRKRKQRATSGAQRNKPRPAPQGTKLPLGEFNGMSCCRVFWQ